uniref:CYTH domain-containing protein n=1 Tax=Desulfobacca acetoxidans TaxID=60893 RepID=A0A7V4G7N9_9BACT
MLVFQTNFDHILKRFEERFPKIFQEDPSWLARIVAEINLYLPDDWRLTRTTNNFRIQLMGKDMPALVGRSYRLPDDNILHIIDSVHKQNYKDKYDQDADYNNLAPNLYFYYPRPEDAETPLFARQYERVKFGRDGKLVGTQYHRVHPLTKAGLDLEHFRWVLWTTGGDARDVNRVAPEYHGKDYWKVESLSDPAGKRQREYIQQYQTILEEFGVSDLRPPERPPHPYEIEYKFLVSRNPTHAKKIFKDIEQKLPELGFRLKGKRQGPRLQVDTYFDDETLHLHQNRTSFRVRSKKDQVRITLKKRVHIASGSSYSPKGLYERLEEEVTITPAQEQALRRGESLNVFPYRLIHYVAPGCGPLKEVVVVKNQRKKLTLVEKHGQEVELCFDQVIYMIEGNEVGPYFEVEIESKGAPRLEVQALAHILEETWGLIPSRQTKYERGVSLLKTEQQPSGKKLVIIDTDCGVDDALALILALKSPELEVKAITTVSGNVHQDLVIRNVFRVLDQINPQPPPVVACGAAAPLRRPFRDAASVHGNDGLGDACNGSIDIQLDDRPAWRVITDLAKNHPKQVTLITIGPMTNLSLAIEKDPEGVHCLKEVVSMGGVFFEVGNVGADAEFNVAADPEAAEAVVKFCRDSCLKTPLDGKGQEVLLPPEPQKKDYDRIKSYRDHDPLDPRMVPLTFVGLDVSHKVILRRATLDRLVKAHPSKSLLKFIQAISAKYMQFYYDNEWLPGCYLHDPLAVAYVINPAFLEIKKHILRVETKGSFTSGVIFPDDRPTRNPAWRNPAEEVINVARGVEKEAFEDFFLERLLLD